MGTEPAFPVIVELVDRFDQADVSLLDQIEQMQIAFVVFDGNLDDQTQIGFDQFILGDMHFGSAFIDTFQDSFYYAGIRSGDIFLLADFFFNDVDDLGLEMPAAQAVIDFVRTADNMPINVLTFSGCR
jgi:hypothetical protein